jgi:hypothetical protein
VCAQSRALTYDIHCRRSFLPGHAQTSSPGFLFPAAGGFQIVEWGRRRLASTPESYLETNASFREVSQRKRVTYFSFASSAGVTTSFVPNPGISGFRPDKRQTRVLYWSVRVTGGCGIKKVRAARARRSAQIDKQAAWCEGNLRLKLRVGRPPHLVKVKGQKSAGTYKRR